MNTNHGDIQKEIARHEADDRQYAQVEGRLRRILGTLTRAGADKDRKQVALRLAQVGLIRESIANEKARLLERKLDAEARIKGVRFIQIARDAVAALDADERASRELKYCLRGLHTIYGRFLAARQVAWQRLVALDAAPDPAEWRTWSQSSVLYLLADVVPLPELRAEIQTDVGRKRFLSLREWHAQNGLHKSISDGGALRRVFEHEPLENLKRIAEALAGNPQMTQILNSLNGQPSKQPTPTAARQTKPKRSVKRGRK